MRLLFLVLFVLVGLIQYPLWLGKGGWFKVWDLQRQVAEQRETNEGLRARNAALEAEVRDLEGGSGAIEERARGELGMMRDGEVFVHILPQNTQPPAAGASPATGTSCRSTRTSPFSGPSTTSGADTATWSRRPCTSCGSTMPGTTTSTC